MAKMFARGLTFFTKAFSCWRLADFTLFTCHYGNAWVFFYAIKHTGCRRQNFSSNFLDKTIFSKLCEFLQISCEFFILLRKNNLTIMTQISFFSRAIVDVILTLLCRCLCSPNHCTSSKSPPVRAAAARLLRYCLLSPQRCANLRPLLL